MLRACNASAVRLASSTCCWKVNSGGMFAGMGPAPNAGVVYVPGPDAAKGAPLAGGIVAVLRVPAGGGGVPDVKLATAMKAGVLTVGVVVTVATGADVMGTGSGWAGVPDVELGVAVEAGVPPVGVMVTVAPGADVTGTCSTAVDSVVAEAATVVLGPDTFFVSCVTMMQFLPVGAG